MTSSLLKQEALAATTPHPQPRPRRPNNLWINVDVNEICPATGWLAQKPSIWRRPTAWRKLQVHAGTLLCLWSSGTGTQSSVARRRASRRRLKPNRGCRLLANDEKWKHNKTLRETRRRRRSWSEFNSLWTSVYYRGLKRLDRKPWHSSGVFSFFNHNKKDKQPQVQLWLDACKANRQTPWTVNLLLQSVDARGKNYFLSTSVWETESIPNSQSHASTSTGPFWFSLLDFFFTWTKKRTTGGNNNSNMATTLWR